ncbi:MAG: efflux RND transporter periplasmic adaptor subunit [Bacteroidota bacterium]
MKKTYWIIIIVVVLALVTGGYFLFSKKTEKAVEFRSGKVEKGDLQVTVTATGILSADTTVAVGTQVSGIITKIFVDFNSIVRKGQVIAVLDTTFLAASVEDAKSSLFRTQVQTRLTKRNYERNKTLLEQKVIAQSDFDQSLSDYETAQANERSARSSLDRAYINLRYATIIAPVSGVVISRNVDIGQTVASSFSTPTLFSIANDLTKMQLQASIDEADIGKIKVGQDVSFRVDAYMDQMFSGTVRQVRLQPVTVQNVVNYTVVIDVPNPELKLMPGMTANLTVKIQEALNVLKAPSASLRFWPPQDYLDKHMKEYPDSIQKMIERMLKFMARKQSGQGSGRQAGGGQLAGGGQSASGGQGGSAGQQQAGGQVAATQQTAGRQQGQGMQPGSRQQGQGMQSGRSQGQVNQALQRGSGQPGSQGRDGRQSGFQAQGQGQQGGGKWSGNNRQKMGLVWVKQGELIVPRRVKTGIADNSSTEIEGSIKEGDELITGIVNTTPGQQTTQQQNPFAPQMGRPQGQSGGGRGGR